MALRVSIACIGLYHIQHLVEMKVRRFQHYERLDMAQYKIFFLTVLYFNLFVPIAQQAEPEVLTFYGAQKSIPRHQFRQPV